LATPPDGLPGQKIQVLQLNFNLFVSIFIVTKVLFNRMIEFNENTDIENKGNRDNTCNTICRVSGLGFRPGLLYVNQNEDNEVIVRNKNGKQNSWFLDDSLDSIPFNSSKPKKQLPYHLASQDETGAKVSYLYMYI